MSSESHSSISVIVPAYNEQEVIEAFHERLVAVLNQLPMSSEIVYVNDGSKDQTLEKLNTFRQSDQRVAILDLSRNFGKEIAMTAGLDYAQGDAVVIIDADLQDPPELIPELIKYWRDGYDNVYAQRRARAGETAYKKLSASYFYKVINSLSRFDIPQDTGDFRLLSRRAVNSLKQLREEHRFMKGLFAWVGYPPKAVIYDRDPRYAGESKWGYWKLWNFALEGITSFTIAPLKLATYIGLLTAALAFIYGAIIIYQTLAFGNPVAGWSSLMVVVLFIGGIQLITLGVIGEYLGRVFNEVKQRPLYFLNSISQSDIKSSE